MSAKAKEIYEFGPFRVDAASRLLMRQGEQIPLTPKAFDILLVFLEKAGQPLESGELIELVWPNNLVEEGNLSVNTSMLRKALGESPGQHRYIMTLPGRDRSVADVRVQTIRDTDLIVEEHTRTHIVIEEESQEKFAIAHIIRFSRSAWRRLRAPSYRTGAASSASG